MGLAKHFRESSIATMKLNSLVYITFFILYIMVKKNRTVCIKLKLKFQHNSLRIFGIIKIRTSNS